MYCVKLKSILSNGQRTQKKINLTSFISGRHLIMPRLFMIEQKWKYRVMELYMNAPKLSQYMRKGKRTHRLITSMKANWSQFLHTYSPVNEISLDVRFRPTFIDKRHFRSADLDHALQRGYLEDLRSREDGLHKAGRGV